MKNLKALALALWGSFLVVQANAQSIQLKVAQDTVHTTDDKSEEYTYVIVKNISVNPINVRVDRVSETLANGHETYFCWDQCYPPTTSSSGSSLKINAGDSLLSFTGHIMPNGYTGISEARFLFSNEDEIDDTASVNLVFNVDAASGIKNVDKNELIQLITMHNELSLYFPYPESNFTMNVFSVTGQLAFQKAYPNAVQSISVSLSTLPMGIYNVQVSSSTLHYNTKILIRH